MKTLAGLLHYVTSDEPLPDAAQCARCKYFDIWHTDVMRILTSRGWTSVQMSFIAHCKCCEAVTADGTRCIERRDNHCKDHHHGPNNTRWERKV